MLYWNKLRKEARTLQRKLRTFLDTIHGSKWAQITPLSLMALLYVISMVIWHPAEIAGWFMPLFIDAFAVGGMYFINRFSSSTWEFSNIAVLFFSVFSALGSLMILTMKPFVFLGEFNPGLGAGPSMFLGISLYHRYRMKKGI